MGIHKRSPAVRIGRFALTGARSFLTVRATEGWLRFLSQLAKARAAADRVRGLGRAADVAVAREACVPRPKPSKPYGEGRERGGVLGCRARLMGFFRFSHAPTYIEKATRFHLYPFEKIFSSKTFLRARQSGRGSSLLACARSSPTVRATEGWLRFLSQLAKARAAADRVRRGRGSPCCCCRCHACM